MRTVQWYAPHLPDLYDPNGPLVFTLAALVKAVIIELNDSGWTFDEIAVHIDSIDNNRDNEMYKQ
jgi:hypothetical protein